MQLLLSVAILCHWEVCVLCAILELNFSAVGLVLSPAIILPDIGKLARTGELNRWSALKSGFAWGFGMSLGLGLSYGMYVNYSRVRIYVYD
jgi:hypothetical protein